MTLRELGGLQAGSTERLVVAEEERLHGLSSRVLAQEAMMEILFLVVLLPLVAPPSRAMYTRLQFQSRIILGDLRLPHQCPT